MELAEELRVSLMRGEKPSKTKKNIKLLIQGLADKRGLLRRTFAKNLGIIGKAALPELCEALLNNENVTVRRAAAKTLKLVGEPAALPSLSDALIHDEDLVVQFSAAGAMAIFGEKAINHFLKIFTDPSCTEMQCGLASWGISFIAQDAPEALKESTISEHSAIRSAAIAALGNNLQNLKKNEAKEILVKALNDSSKEVNHEAIRCLGNLKDSVWAEQALLDKINDKSPDIRKSVALSLMKLEAFNTTKELKAKRLEEKDESVLKVYELAISYLEKK